MGAVKQAVKRFKLLLTARSKLASLTPPSLSSVQKHCWRYLLREPCQPRQTRGNYKGVTSVEDVIMSLWIYEAKDKKKRQFAGISSKTSVRFIQKGDTVLGSKLSGTTAESRKKDFGSRRITLLEA
ncbi:hypothetical protein CEXT_619411 [Caerostris extrusa]|uniref:Uncharacterized protein n=1 Tax=Caerostris extrusa TaxID=172846 RepID=A0AAV4Y8F2_CAEEX|nr:hypothetical protein CEXT_619411 [Caerostris extrusa]